MEVPRSSDSVLLHWLPTLTRPKPLQRLWRDPVLLGVMVLCAVLLIYQLAETLIRPPWGSEVTDWLRAALAWPALCIMTLASVTATRTRRPEARAWWMLSIALLFYTLARTMWSVEDEILYPHHAPFPSFPDPFFMLQYPFFFLAIILMPSGRSWESRLKLALDGLLIMGSTTALCWYFLLEPLYMQSHVSLIGRFVNLYYPTMDLAILFGLTITFIYHQSRLDRMLMALLIAAMLCLVTADAWVAWLIAQAGFTAGSPPDLFWMGFYLLLPLAGLVWLRHSQYIAPLEREQQAICTHRPLQREDLKDIARLLFPFVAALLASGVLASQSILAPIHTRHPLTSILVIVALLLLVLVRQGLALLEYIQVRRERSEARASELALREINRQMETFLGMASHELKTPLTSILMGLQVIQRRIRSVVHPRVAAAENGCSSFMTSQDVLDTTMIQAERLNRLINDLLDTSRIQSGRLELKFASIDLRVTLVRTIEELRQAAPERTILLMASSDKPVSVWGDAERIGQVMTNYLTNALKYSAETRLVRVGLEVESGRARVWVRDQGPGIASEEQAHVWDRFHRVSGIEVQSGSGVGLGLGLYISKTIIERHHGQVGVESVRGQGSTFWFTLPLLTPGAGLPPDEDASETQRQAALVASDASKEPCD